MAGDRAFLSISALLFLMSAVATIYWCQSMTGGMPMPGGWIMSMAWMRVAGQSIGGAALAFLGMWTVMMAAMMLPSLVPTLLNYRCSLRSAGNDRPGTLTALAGAGYFFIWIGFGAAVYLLGRILTAAEMRWATVAGWVPMANAIILVLAGLPSSPHGKRVTCKLASRHRCWSAHLPRSCGTDGGTASVWASTALYVAVGSWRFCSRLG